MSTNYTIEKVDKQQIGSMSDHDLRKLAHDMYQGVIFTDRHLPVENRSEMMSTCFMVWGLMDPIERAKIIEGNLGMVYARLDRETDNSGSGVNGYPILWAMRLLNKQDAVTVNRYYDEIKAKMEQYV